MDLRPLCKFEFVRCGTVEKTRALYLSGFSRGAPMKFKNTFFQIVKLRFFTIFQKKSKGKSLKARCLIFWILAISINILTPVWLITMVKSCLEYFIDPSPPALSCCIFRQSCQRVIRQSLPKHIKPQGYCRGWWSQGGGARAQRPSSDINFAFPRKKNGLSN